jgi:NAD(P)-dependent dehydrogenase (short-subunit alcohol dehydrogenase family)
LSGDSVLVNNFDDNNDKLTYTSSGLMAVNGNARFTKLFDLTGRTALITGGSVGFGKIISLGLAEYGCHVAVADLDLEGRERLSLQRWRNLAGRSESKLTSAIPLASRQWSPRQVEELGTLDILVNCAGVSQHDPAELTPLETWDRVIDINLRGTFLACQAASHVMLEKGRGVIINFSSIAGEVGMGRGANAYCASKGGVNTLTKQLALEWARRGIRVNAVAPCQFMTPGLVHVMEDPQFDPDRLMETWISNIPLGRVGQPEEIFGAVLFLASDASSMVTGTVLNVDGGLSRSMTNIETALKGAVQIRNRRTQP